MTLKITLAPNLRPAFELAAAEDRYANRLVELFETAAFAKEAHDDWVNQSRPAFHRWVTYNNLALEEATKPWLPSERRKVSAVVTFGVDNV